MTYPLVLVRWQDNWCDNDPPDGGYRTTYPVETVGWMIRDDKVLLSVAQELLPEMPPGDVSTVTHIWKVCVTSVTNLVPRRRP